MSSCNTDKSYYNRDYLDCNISEYYVKGRILLSNNAVGSGLVVKAFDKNLRRESFLGKTVTNCNGCYIIPYKKEDLINAQKGKADLIIRVFSKKGTLYGESEVCFNAPPRMKINLTVVPTPDLEPSEYEKNMENLRPYLSDINPATLTDDEITYLVDASKINRQNIEGIREAAIYEQKTDLSIEVYYGLISQNISLDLNESTDDIMSALQSAISENIIPAHMSQSLEDIRSKVDLIKRKDFSNKLKMADVYQLTGQLLDENNAKYLTGYTVEVSKITVDGEVEKIGYAKSEDIGQFAVTYTVIPNEDAREAISMEKFSLRITNPEGVEVATIEKEIPAGSDQVLEIPVAVIDPPAPPSPSIAELKTTLDIDITEDDLSYLNENNIFNLDDIRRSGGIKDSPLNQEVVKLLNDHAMQYTVSKNLEVNHHLILNGIDSPSKNDETLRTDFVKEINERLGDNHAFTLQLDSSVQRLYLNNKTTEAIIDRANGFIRPDFQAIKPLLPEKKCTCEDCEAAVSPLAYLADLIEYAQNHIKDDNQKITLAFLNETFFQLFGDLPASCEEMDKKINQVRICIEVIRRYLEKKGLPIPNTCEAKVLNESEKSYCFEAYKKLLVSLGTSYDEIRLIRYEDENKRQLLAERIGIDIEHLEELFLDEPLITEDKLEVVFGLLDTRRNPLEPDIIPDILKWRLEYLRSLWKNIDWPTDLPEYPQPLIDPAVIDINDLRKKPDHDKTEAQVLWDERNDWIKNKKYELKNIFNNSGLIETIQQGLGISETEMENIYSNLKTTNKDKIEEAKNAIESLDLTVERFVRLIEIINKQHIFPQMSEEELEEICNEVYHIIIYAMKKKENQKWKNKETYYLITLDLETFCIDRTNKELPIKWLADNDERQQLIRYIQIRSSRPLIDPDLMDYTYLKDPDENNPVYTLLEDRIMWIEERIQHYLDIHQEIGVPLESFNKLIRTVIGIKSVDTLNDWSEMRKDGLDIKPNLEKYTLSMDAFLFLSAVGRRLSQQSSAEILDSEWQDVYSILVQIEKQRQYSKWRDEEKARNLILSPDIFTVPHNSIADAESKLPARRASIYDLRNWIETLQSRIEQEESVISKWREAISTTEGDVLPTLRDALIFATDAEGTTLNAKAKWLIDRLLIDTEKNSCAKTTRISQAIETLQNLIFLLHTKHLKDIYPSLKLEVDNFEEDWKWMGSYATWRAAMFIHLYPENILLPSLRSIQTPIFRQLVKNLRSNHRLTPEGACVEGKKYEDYFRDIFNMKVKAVSHGYTLMQSGTCRNKTRKIYNDLIYLFAKGARTKKTYWSFHNPKVAYDDAISFWQPVDGIEDKNVEIIGAQTYHTTDTRFICLFLKEKVLNEEKLMFTKYNLETNKWDELPTPLDLPKDNGKEPANFNAIVIQRKWFSSQPYMAIQTPNGGVYIRHININGTGWEEKDFQMRIVPKVGKDLTLNYIVEYKYYSFCMLATSRINLELKYRMLGNEDDGQWRSFNEFGDCTGAFLWDKKQDQPQIIVNRRITEKAKDQPKYEYGSGLDASYYVLSPQIGYPFIKKEYDNIYDFANWISNVSGIDLFSEPFIASYSGLEKLNLIQTIHYFNIDRLQRFYFSGMYIISDYHRDLIDNINRIADKVKNNEDWQRADNLVKKYTKDSLSIRDCLIILSGWQKDAKLFSPKNTRNITIRQRHDVGERSKSIKDSPDISKILVANIFETNRNHYIQINDGGQRGSYLGYLEGNANQIKKKQICRISLKEAGPLDIVENIPQGEIQKRRSAIKKAFSENKNTPKILLNYLEEAYYYVPVHLALQLEMRGQYDAALNWFRTVYDYSEPLSQRIIYSKLEEIPNQKNLNDWFRDPINPHTIASTRTNANIRFIQISIAKCFLDYADAEYSKDNVESIPKARNLYLKALEILDTKELKQNLNNCQEIIDKLDSVLDPCLHPSISKDLKSSLWGIIDINSLREAISDVKDVIAQSQDINKDFIKAVKIIHEKKNKLPIPQKISHVLDSKIQLENDIHRALIAHEDIFNEVKKAKEIVSHNYLNVMSEITGYSINQLKTEKLELDWLRMENLSVPLWDGLYIQPNYININPLIQTDKSENIFNFQEKDYKYYNVASPTSNSVMAIIDKSAPLQSLVDKTFNVRTWIPKPQYYFCTPPNPIIKALRLRAENNLKKIRNCLNIHGMQRQLEPYAAPTDTSSGMPMIIGGQLRLPSTIYLPPTPYRYSFLIERSKQLVNLAMTIESTFLLTLEKRDAEYYNLLKARQELSLSRATVRLRDLQVRQAKDGIKLSELQQARAQIQEKHFQTLLNEGLTDKEIASLALMCVAATHSFAAASAYWMSIGSLLSSTAQGFSTIASILSTQASFERREQDWQFNKDLATQDIRISEQQIKISEDQLDISEQEKTIAQMQSDFSADVVEFLNNKFTNTELYDWMSNILEGVYRFFLYQATATAKLAERQLTFERQEIPLILIQDDYWESPMGILPSNITEGQGVDRRGITGSARLLQDIHQLDQYAFESQKKKLQLSKTISLLSLDPVAFQRFRETGKMYFTTPMEIFDRDFPGHYLRQIKQIRTSVIALIPPNQGIKATLSSTGLSKAVIGKDKFEKVTIKTLPESVAFSSPNNTAVQFELQSEPGLLLPFEGMGVESNWLFEMPRAANMFDYNTIADVLITIDYTALYSFDYKQQVIQELNPFVKANRLYSFRHQFADQWYDLNNPEQTETPMLVKFNTTRENFPPNIENIKIDSITLYFVPSSDKSFEVEVRNFTLTPQDENETPLGGPAKSIDGVIKDALSWFGMKGKAPFGVWKLDLNSLSQDISNDARTLIENGDIIDILFVITYKGRTMPY